MTFALIALGLVGMIALLFVIVRITNLVRNIAVVVLHVAESIDEIRLSTRAVANISAAQQTKYEGESAYRQAKTVIDNAAQEQGAVQIVSGVMTIDEDGDVIDHGMTQVLDMDTVPDVVWASDADDEENEE